jgi:hypothetical protein
VSGIKTHGGLAFLAFWLLLVFLGADASLAAELPLNAPDKHLGVGSCSGAPCHGSGAPAAGVVRQNEHATWLREDKHAQAYQVLSNERSQRIARNLGLHEPANQSTLCLNCHADNVPPERRGAKFSIEEGVTCEACHGGSERWLKAHAAAGASHQRNLEIGLYPTDDVVARAELCVSCHFGDEDRFVSHRIMGAGHPRMIFELDTFTQLEPAHFDVDADYAERGKQSTTPANTWAVGQAVQIRHTLAVLASPARGREGIWPELVVYDCYGCHHPMSALRWAPRPSLALADKPGVPRLNDAAFLMLRHALGATTPGAAARLEAETRALHVAMSGRDGSLAAAISSLRQIVDGAIPGLAKRDFMSAQVRAIASGLIQAGGAGEYPDYAAAEQAVMAVQSLAAALDRFGEIDPRQRERINADIDALLGLTRDGERYAPAQLPPLLRRLHADLR